MLRQVRSNCRGEIGRKLINFSVISDQIGEKRGAGLSSFELKTLQRVLLEMFCQYELSSCFRVLPPHETSKSYYEIVMR